MFLSGNVVSFRNHVKLKRQICENIKKYHKYPSLRWTLPIEKASWLLIQTSASFTNLVVLGWFFKKLFTVSVNKEPPIKVIVWLSYFNFISYFLEIWKALKLWNPRLQWLDTDQWSTYALIWLWNSFNFWRILWIC